MSTTISKRMLTPPELAAEWGVEHAKVLAWIRSGELRAVNLATNPRGRPRWHIDRAEVRAFEQRRAAVVKPPPEQHRRKAESPDVIEYF